MSEVNIPIASPGLGDEEVEEVVKVLKSGFIAQGSKVLEFEKEFAEFIGTDFAVATNSGTSALHTALLASGIGEGDEVITTPFSFVATGNSILYTGAKPVFVDIDEDTYNINPDKIAITEKTKAIMPVHLYGQSADMDEIMKIAKDNDLLVIEDAAQAHGAIYKNENSIFDGRKIGNIGDLGCFSFYPTKNMTTGEGGMITTNNEEYADKAKMIRSHGEKERYKHSILGYNFRLTDISAAIGLVQLKKLNNFNQKRIENAKFLNKELSNVKGIKTPKVKGNSTHVYHQYTIAVENNRDEWVKYLNDNGIGTGIHYSIAIYNQELYKNLGFNNNNCPVTEKVINKVISLPIHPKISENDLKYIVSKLKEASNLIG